MPAFAFVAFLGLALIVLKLVADTSPVSPPGPRHRDTREIAAQPVPAPDVAKQTKPKPEEEVMIEPKARAARAQAPPTMKRITRQPIGHRLHRYRQNNWTNKFSIGGQ